MDKDELIHKYRISEGEVQLPQGTIRVRGLSRAEVFKVQEMNVQEGEAHTLHLAMLDPKISLDEAKEWQANSPAYEIEPVTDKINELSRVQLSNQAVMHSFHEGSGA